jgi:hypothetical protein
MEDYSSSTTCPEGFFYKRAFTVPGGCINNSKKSLKSTRTVDPRCPSGMHWRKEHHVKGKCIRHNKTRTKRPKNTEEELPTCDPFVVDMYWKDHLKLILSTAQEPENLGMQEINKIRRRFIETLQQKMRPHHCVYRPSDQENVMLYNFIVGAGEKHSTITIHCPHCNRLIQVTPQEPNTLVRCPYCFGNIRLE